MAGHFFPFKAGERDAERFFRAIAPAQVQTAVDQAFSALPCAADSSLLAAQMDEILRDEIGWLERAVTGARDSELASKRLLGRLGEGLNMDLKKATASSGFEDGARLNTRNALYFCWIALPKDRRTPADVGRIVRLAVSRKLAAVEELRREILRS